MKSRKPIKKEGFKGAVVKSALIHVCVIMLFAISPGFDLAIKDKPIDVVWVELPKGDSDEIGFGVGPSTDAPGGYPSTTVEQQKTPPPMEQEPMELVQKPVKQSTDAGETAGKPQKPTIEKSVTASARMTYSKKGAPRRRYRRKTDRKIANALAMIDKQLGERSTSPQTGQAGGYSGGGGGYKYGTGTRPIRVLPSDPEYIKYQARVRSKIINKWVIPERFSTLGVSANAKLIVMINMNGEVISTRWSKQSGNPSFDESAKRAVERASPFPKPPQRLAWETYNEGFLIEFDARAR